jgi:ATP-dependent DNA helicase RecG
MERFRAGELEALVATTVIEVGVDVPNAVVMVIMNAEMFGLAQLHQLRGRVARSQDQAYCILVTGKQSDAARERIRTMVDSGDGFYIAEMDLRLMFRKQISLVGSTMGSHQDFRDVMSLILAGKLKAVIDRVMPLAEGRAAHELLERGEQFGKIVLEP